MTSDGLSTGKHEPENNAGTVLSSVSVDPTEAEIGTEAGSYLRLKDFCITPI
jgi:hypothetical protein